MVVVYAFNPTTGTPSVPPNRYALVGSYGVRTLADAGSVRRRDAPDVAEQAYANELTERQAAPPPQPDATDEPDPPVHATPPSMTPLVETANGTRLVAAVAVLKRDEWANLVQTLPLGADRWRFIALDKPASGLDDLIVISVNGSTGRSQ